MVIKEVISPGDKKKFHDFPRWLYKNDPCWICPPDSMIENIFDPAGNRYFDNGVATRWILIDSSSKVIGRVAAFIDNKRSEANRQPTGGLGFFEVTEDREAAYMLFDTAKEWLSERGMEAMDGPVNFGENDNHWGLLVEGFMQQGFGMPYNKKYYRSFFEDYGFRNYFEQYSYHSEVRGADNKIVNFPNRIMKVAEWLTKRPGYDFRHFEFRNSLKYFQDLCDIYNTTWIYLKDDFTPLDPDILNEALKRSKLVLDEELIWFAYYNDKPIGFFVLLPDLNQILRHLNGKLHFINLLRLVYYKLTHEMTRMRAVVGGVLHSHQNTGVEAAIFFKLYEVFQRKPWFRELELSWVGDYNSRMLATYETLGAKRAKTHITYRLMINKKLEFIRYKDEAADNERIKKEEKKL